MVSLSSHFNWFDTYYFLVWHLQIESNPVVVIKGDTGSGKTTRVPLMILNHWRETKGRATSSWTSNRGLVSNWLSEISLIRNFFVECTRLLRSPCRSVWPSVVWSVISDNRLMTPHSFCVIGSKMIVNMHYWPCPTAQTWWHRVQYGALFCLPLMWVTDARIVYYRTFAQYSRDSTPKNRCCERLPPSLWWAWMEWGQNLRLSGASVGNLAHAKFWIAPGPEIGDANHEFFLWGPRQRGLQEILGVWKGLWNMKNLSIHRCLWIVAPPRIHVSSIALRAFCCKSWFKIKTFMNIHTSSLMKFTTERLIWTSVYWS